LFTRVEFQNFKALRDYSLSVRKVNVLTGANNAGKSTVLDAFRALAGAVKFAHRHLPNFEITLRGRFYRGYKIPTSSLPFATANIQTDYQTVDATVVFELDNGLRLTLLFDTEQNCRLLLDPKGPSIASLANFKRHYPISIAVVPTLGPLEEEEPLRTDQYVEDNERGRRAHRVFRNIWYRKPAQEFGELKNLTAETWPGMDLQKPERTGYGDDARIQMFCSEEHRLREVFWAGFGFQVWLQFLTHIIGANKATTIIIDEPDIYLHPDLQHKLFHLLKVTEKQFLLATHSVEIINEADYDDVVLINKKHRKAKRIGDVDGMQAAIETLGSKQSIHLNRLSRARKVLFFEGQDFQLVKRFATKLGLDALAAGINFSVIGIGGFSEHKKIENAIWPFEEILETTIQVAAVLDRDYQNPEQVSEFLNVLRERIPHSYVLERKEIENYLLDADALARCIRERCRHTVFTVKGQALNLERYARSLITRATVKTKKNTQALFTANYLENIPRGSLSRVTHTKNAILAFDARWKPLETRLQMVPGKEVFSIVNRILQEEQKISVTHAQLIKHMHKDAVPADLTSILKNLETFAVR